MNSRHLAWFFSDNPLYSSATVTAQRPTSSPASSIATIRERLSSVSWMKSMSVSVLSRYFIRGACGLTPPEDHVPISRQLLGFPFGDISHGRQLSGLPNNTKELLSLQLLSRCLSQELTAATWADQSIYFFDKFLRCYEMCPYVCHTVYLLLHICDRIAISER